MASTAGIMTTPRTLYPRPPAPATQKTLHPSLDMLFSTTESDPVRQTRSRPPPSSPSTSQSHPTAVHLRSLALLLLRILEEQARGVATQTNVQFLKRHVRSTSAQEVQAQASLIRSSKSPMVRDPLLAEAGETPEHADLIDCGTEISSNGRRAKVWIINCLGGVALTSNEAVIVMEFEQKCGTWVCYKLVCLKGVAECA